MDSQRLEFWKRFLVADAGFPYPDRLEAQLAVAAFSEFCDCGCNSFAVSVAQDAGVQPIYEPGHSDGAFFQSAVLLDPSGNSLEIVLFSDEIGNLSFVEIHFNGNSEPVPTAIDVQGPPYHVHAESGLVP